MIPNKKTKEKAKTWMPDKSAQAWRERRIPGY